MASTLLMVGALFLPLLTGCEQGKQTAVLGIDEAWLTIASARKAQAEVYSASALSNAEASLKLAEKKFKAGNFSVAKQEAGKATQFARDAESEAQRKASERKSRKRAKKA